MRLRYDLLIFRSHPVSTNQTHQLLKKALPTMSAPTPPDPQKTPATSTRSETPDQTPSPTAAPAPIQPTDNRPLIDLSGELTAEQIEVALAANLTRHLQAGYLTAGKMCSSNPSPPATNKKKRRSNPGAIG